MWNCYGSGFRRYDLHGGFSIVSVCPDGRIAADRNHNEVMNHVFGAREWSVFVTGFVFGILGAYVCFLAVSRWIGVTEAGTVFGVLGRGGQARGYCSGVRSRRVWWRLSSGTS